ncbi:MAG TPA: glutamyl-tRNA reductase [Thermoanaerobaculia bacterium]|nr:glutamyl-tRNA reductase [Thermoanaerobaculia bacterium]
MADAPDPAAANGPSAPGGPSRTAAGGPSLLLLGIDFHTVPIELRERVALGQEEAEKTLVHLLARSAIAEAMLLSTCNRTEVLLQPRDEEEAYRAALQLVFLARAPEIERPGLLYVKRDHGAARHLLGVACGLESMVLGEPEILGQVKQAAALAEAVGAAGPVLRQLQRSALVAGRRARQETAIAAGAVSLGYAVIELARNIFRDLDDCRVLLIGAGEISRAVARNLAERGARQLTVANRSPERARQFQELFPTAAALPFAERLAAIRDADMVIASTGADEPVLTRRQLAEAMGARPSRALLVVDLGVPRNVDPEAGRIENVFLHSLDSLDHLIQRNLKRRKEEMPRVHEILDQEVAHFYGWYRGMQAEPLIASLQKQAERIRRQELAEALHHFPAASHAHLDRLTRSLVRKILHHPSNRLRGRGGPEHLPRLDLVRELFRLDDADGSAAAAAAGEIAAASADESPEATAYPEDRAGSAAAEPNAKPEAE